jgi:hypothetical protein
MPSSGLSLLSTLSPVWLTPLLFSRNARRSNWIGINQSRDTVGQIQLSMRWDSHKEVWLLAFHSPQEFQTAEFMLIGFLQLAIAAATDIILSILPVIFLWRVQISLKIKLGVCGLMALGFAWVASKENGFFAFCSHTLGAADLLSHEQSLFPV